MNALGTLLRHQTFEDLNSKIRNLLQFLTERKKFTIATSIIAATYALYKIIQNHKDGQQSFPNFEGASRFEDQRQLLIKSPHTLAFMQTVNPNNLPAGYCKFSFTRCLTICDVR